MIIYERDKKELIVPATFAGGGDSNCGPAIEKAYEEGYESGWTEGYASGSSECRCELQEKTIEIDTTTYEVLPDEGYDGLEAVYVNASDLADNYFHSGWTEGYASGTSECSGTNCDLQVKGVEITDTTYEVLPDEGYDGMSSVYINAGPLAEAKYLSGHTEGVEDGKEEIRDQFTTLYVSNSGRYECSGDAAYNVVEVNVSNGYTAIMSGTIITDHDIVYDGQQNHISVLIQGENNTVELNHGYIYIDGISAEYWQGSTLTTGTHTFMAYITEWVLMGNYFEPWWPEVYLFENGQGNRPDGVINVLFKRI